MNKILFIVVMFLVGISSAFACTNFLITKGASADGSTMISYAADSHVLYGELYHWPAANYPEGSMLEVYEWDTGKYMGKIRQVSQTYNVIGNMNEYQVAIGETTYGGPAELEKRPTENPPIVDYGGLIYISLQRSKTAREAIKCMAELMMEYGYASTGESFSIADKNEVWIMEIIGKGEKDRGAVWVALRIPDGYISAHANHPRITTFPLENCVTSISTKNLDKIFESTIECVYAEDIISFARSQKLYPEDAKDENFSFSDVYYPVDFFGARFCEIRVWAMFRQVHSQMDQYLDYVEGSNVKNRMPLWIKPERKISVQDMMAFMRDHLEGTKFDMTKDVGAGSYGCPYRWRPLTWKVAGVEYCNERATATQQTGFSFISQSRSWLPDKVGGIIWFGIDDAANSVYVPMYTSMTEVPESHKVGNGDMMTFSDTSAFWAFNQVANFCYTRYNVIHPEIEGIQKALENKFVAYTPVIDQAACTLLEKDANLAVQFLTDYSVNAGMRVTHIWKDLYKYLFLKYMDGNIKKKKTGERNPEVKQPGYSEKWYRQIVEDNGNILRVK